MGTGFMEHYLKLHSHTSQNHFIRPVVIIFHSLYSFFFIIDAVIMDKGVLMMTYLGCGDFIDFILILSVIELRGCNKNAWY